MWRLVKSEFKYNWYTYSLLTITLVLYTIFSLIDFNLTHDNNFNTDLWGGLYSFVFVVFILSVWGQRLKEKRNRYFAILPISVKYLAVSRFSFVAIPFTIMVIYLTLIHLAIMNSWHSESSSLLLQIGVLSILFAGFIRARDDWFSHWNFGRRTQAAFVSVLIIQVLLVGLFVVLPGSYRSFTPIFGEMFYHYVKIIFYLLGLVIMTTTIFSFIKRKSYLS